MVGNIVSSNEGEVRQAMIIGQTLDAFDPWRLRTIRDGETTGPPLLSALLWSSPSRFTLHQSVRYNFIRIASEMQLRAA